MPSPLRLAPPGLGSATTVAAADGIPASYSAEPLGFLWPSAKHQPRQFRAGLTGVRKDLGELSDGVLNPRVSRAAVAAVLAMPAAYVSPFLVTPRSPSMDVDGSAVAPGDWSARRCRRSGDPDRPQSGER